MSLSLRLHRGNKTEKQKNKRTDTVDRALVAIILSLLMFGLVMVFSASSAWAHYLQQDATYYFKRQLIWAVVGLASMAVVSNISYKVIYKYTNMLFMIAVAMIILVLIPGIGREANGARRWLGFGQMTFQPSEFAKLGLIIYLARAIHRDPKSVTKLIGSKWNKGGFVQYVAIILIVAGIVILEPHMSGALVVVFTGMAVLFVAGFKMRYFVGLAFPAVPAAMALAIFSPYRLKRLEAFINPFADKLGKNYQIIQSLYAIGSGGIFGLGLGQSRQKFLYIPEPQNDFIYSILCEELGFVGAVFLLLLFALLIWKGITISRKAPDIFSSLTAAGITALVAIQVLLNIAVVTSTIPNTGIPLPFFSYGGTSLWMLLTEMGVLLSISRHTSK